MISEPMHPPLRQPVVPQRNDKKKGAIESMPEGIMMFNINPIKGPNLISWSVKPCNEWFTGGSENQEAIKILFKNTAAGAFIGGCLSFALRGALFCFSRSPLALTSPIPDVATGVVIGGASGFLKGVIDVNQFYLKRSKVLHATEESAKRAQRIMQAFIDARLEFRNTQLEDRNISIFCPISLELMVYPARAACGSKVSHTFEFFSLLDALKRNNGCPTCRQEINITEIVLDDDVEQEVKKIVGDILWKMEGILEKLPKKLFGSDTNFDDPKILTELSDMLKKGKAFLNGNIDEIIEKISNPETLSLEETYALGYFIIHQIRPIKKKIDIIYEVLGAKLRSMQTNYEISQETYEVQDQKVKNWYKQFNIIPERCKIMKKLYAMKGVIRGIERNENKQGRSV